MPVELIAKIQQKNDGPFKLVDAEDVEVADAGNLFAGDNVEAVLQEIGAGASLPAGDDGTELIRDAAAPTGVTFVKARDLNVQRAPFYAVPDSVTPSAAAIQAAFDEAATTGAKVLIPGERSGSYLIETQLEVASASPATAGAYVIEG